MGDDGTGPAESRPPYSSANRGIGSFVATRLGPLPFSDWLWLLGVTVLAAIPRWWHLGQASLWTDEFICRGAVMADGLWAAGRVIVEHNHPPARGWVAYLWCSVFGTGEWGLRSLSALAGTLTPAMVWVVGRKGGFPRGAWIAALLVAIWPLHVHQSRDAVPYTLYGLLVLFQLWSFLDLGEPGRPTRWWAWVRHGLLVAIHVASFNLAAVYLVVENLLFIGSPRRRLGRLAVWIPMQIWLVGLVLLGFVVMNDQFDWYMGQRVAPELGAVELVGRGISVPGELLRYDLQQLQWQGIEGGWLGRERALDGSGPGLALWVLLVAGLAAIHGMGRATAETGTLRRALPLLAYGLVPLLAYGVAAEEFRGAKAFLAAGALLAVILGEAAAVVGRHRVAVALLWILLAAPLVAVLPRVVTRHPGYETREAVAWLEQRRGPIEVPAAGERVEPVVVHMGHMYCPVAYYAVPGVELCDWPTQNRWPPDAPHAELRSVFIAIDYTVGVPHHEAASYTIEFEQVFEGALSGAESFWLVLSEDRVFADPDRSRLRPWLQPYRVIDGRLFHGLEVYRLCRRGVAWCDRMEPPSELPPIIP